MIERPSDTERRVDPMYWAGYDAAVEDIDRIVQEAAAAGPDSGAGSAHVDGGNHLDCATNQ